MAKTPRPARHAMVTSPRLTSNYLVLSFFIIIYTQAGDVNTDITGLKYQYALAFFTRFSERIILSFIGYESVAAEVLTSFGKQILKDPRRFSRSYQGRLQKIPYRHRAKLFPC